VPRSRSSRRRRRRRSSSIVQKRYLIYITNRNRS
jgi:hypothetical protein